MTSRIKVTPPKENMLEKEGLETPPDRALLNLSDAAVKELIRSAEKRGYVTHDQINALLSSEDVKSEQIEEVLATFSATGISVVETKETEFEEEVATGEEPEEEAEGENRNGPFRPSPRPGNPLSAPTTPCACTSAKWVRRNCFRAKVRSLSLSALRPAARP